MTRKNRVYLVLGISIICILMFTLSAISIQPAKAQVTSSSDIKLTCIYGVGTGLLKGTDVCPITGTPTVLSLVKNQIAGELTGILQNDEKQYRLMVFDGLQCGQCRNFNITAACKYDRSGNFVVGFPPQQLSDVQKAVILDLKNSFSIDICLLTGKPNIPYDSAPPHTIIGPSGSVNVTKIGRNNNQSNNSNSTYSNPSIQKTTNGTFVYTNTLSPLKQFESGISSKNVQCKQGFVLLVKKENGHPSCVKPTSVTRLLANGWITP